jgi:hypothetical protein
MITLQGRHITATVSHNNALTLAFEVRQGQGDDRKERWVAAAEAQIKAIARCKQEVMSLQKEVSGLVNLLQEGRDINMDELKEKSRLLGLLKKESARLDALDSVKVGYTRTVKRYSITVQPGEIIDAVMPIVAVPFCWVLCRTPQLENTVVKIEEFLPFLSPNAIPTSPVPPGGHNVRLKERMKQLKQKQAEANSLLEVEVDFRGSKQAPNSKANPVQLKADIRGKRGPAQQRRGKCKICFIDSVTALQKCSFHPGTIRNINYGQYFRKPHHQPPRIRSKKDKWSCCNSKHDALCTKYTNTHQLGDP